MKHRGIEIVVGAFVLVGVAVVLVGIFAISGRTFGNLSRYDILYRNVSSITANTPVKYNGLLVGRVETMKIDPADISHIRVMVSILAETPVTTETIAKITRSDILGDEYIDLRPRDVKPGSPGALQILGEPLQPGSVIEAGEPFDLQAALQALSDTVRRTDSILADIQVQAQAGMATINRLLGRGEELLSEENVALLQRTLDDLGQTVSRVRMVADENSVRIDQLMSDATATTTSLRTTAENVQASMQRMLPQIESLTGEVRDTVKQMKGLAQTADTTLGAVDVQTLNDMVENLDVASRNLAEFTREIKERPYRLIRKEKPEEAAP